MDILTKLFLFVLTVLSVGYYFIRKRFAYWSDRGIPYIEPTFPYGNLKGAGKTIHIAKLIAKYYNEMKNKATYCGLFFFVKPVLLVLDLDLIKTILVKDFQYFVDRGMYHNERDDPLSAHLLSLEGTKWRNLRTKLSPTFTSGKMKMMFPIIISIAGEFKAVLKESIENNPDFEMKDMLARFTTDVIGTCAFGLKCNSLKDPNAKFRQMGRKMFDTPRNLTIKRLFMITFGDLSRRLHLKFIEEEVSTFFMQAVKDTIEYRETNNIEGNDFMDLLLQLKNNGKLNDDTSSELGSLSVEEIAAQAFLFFLAGFETSSTTMSYSLYELSQNIEIQEKARQEVITVLNKYSGQMSYEAMCEMKYIDQIIKETLRMYPPIGILLRKATSDYTIPDTNQLIKKGTPVIIPAYAIHHDPEIYPNPEEFNPDRFSDEEIKNRSPYVFLPFGEGPRMCIGLRFGMMQARIGLATLLTNFKFSPCSKSIIPMKFSAKDFVLTPEGGLWLNVMKINKNE